MSVEAQSESASPSSKAKYLIATLGVMAVLAGGVFSTFQNYRSVGDDKGRPALSYSVDGRYLSAGGLAIRNAMILMIDNDNGAVRTAVTSSFGVFRFDDVPAGSYITVKPEPGKRFRVDPFVSNVNDNIQGIVLQQQQ